MSDPTPRLHPAQNRGLRELYAFARQLVAHWTRLAPRLGAGPAAKALETGAEATRQLLAELTDLTPAYGLHGFPVAQGVGARLAGMRNVVADRTLERNQALRMAVLDLQHLTALLAYLAALGDSTGDERMRDFCGRWERRLKRQESAVRRAAVATAEDPEAAIEPLDRTAAGRAGRGVANAMGTFGEWFDRRAAQRRARR
ncbi:MAG: hypothetical protein ACJ76S_09585 [Solirubrobacteraceae bacterium]